MTGSFHSHVTNTVREITGIFSFRDIAIAQGQNPLGRAIDSYVITPNGQTQQYDSFLERIRPLSP